QQALGNSVACALLAECPPSPASRRPRAPGKRGTGGSGSRLKSTNTTLSFRPITRLVIMVMAIRRTVSVAMCQYYSRHRGSAFGKRAVAVQGGGNGRRSLACRGHEALP